MTIQLSAEFLVEPFAEGTPGEHVLAAVAAVESHGLEVEFGPFGTTTAGDDRTVLAALHEAFGAALARGASRVNLTLVRLDDQ